MEINSEIDIDAPVETVWSVLLDVEAIPTWNPFIISLSGDLTPGGRLQVTVRPPGQKPMRFKPIVKKITEHSELRWLGRVLIPGLFDGEHFFRLTPLEGGRTRFHHGEKFNGLLVPLFRGILKATEQGFKAMNQALKARAEALAQTNPRDTLAE